MVPMSWKEPNCLPTNPVEEEERERGRKRGGRPYMFSYWAGCPKISHKSIQGLSAHSFIVCLVGKRK